MLCFSVLSRFELLDVVAIKTCNECAAGTYCFINRLSYPFCYETCASLGIRIAYDHSDRFRTTLPGTGINFLKKTFTEFSEDQCTTLAAALAYYTAFALPPLLYLLLLVLTFGLTVMYDGDAAEKKAEGILKSQASQMIGNQAASDQIGKILENNQNASCKWWQTLISFAGIIAGATGVVGAFRIVVGLDRSSKIALGI